MKSNLVVAKLINVSKKYILHHEKPTLSEQLINGRREEFWAIKNINLTINKGERIGIIGANGSGKTTLLKLITGIASPTRGRVEVFGKVISLIDLDAGFHPDLSGIKNIYLSGSVLGMSKKDVDSCLNEIVEFAELGKFIDAPIYTYSSGMMLRLGFSIAVHSNPDILILDENISVGDINFQQKSLNKIEELFSKGKTLIIASHNMIFVKKLCTRVVWLRNNKKVVIGTPTKIISLYESV